MKESELLRTCIDKTQDAWEKMSLGSKRKKIIAYWENMLDDTDDPEKIEFINEQILMAEVLDAPEINEYLESVHKSIIEDAEKCYQKELQKEREE